MDGRRSRIAQSVATLATAYDYPHLEIVNNYGERSSVCGHDEWMTFALFARLPMLYAAHDALDRFQATIPRDQLGRWENPHDVGQTRRHANNDPEYVALGRTIALEDTNDHEVQTNREMTSIYWIEAERDELKELLRECLASETLGLPNSLAARVRDAIGEPPQKG